MENTGLSEGYPLRSPIADGGKEIKPTKATKGVEPK
jgi:hypothetical protein